MSRRDLVLFEAKIRARLAGTGAPNATPVKWILLNQVQNESTCLSQD